MQAVLEIKNFTKEYSQGKKAVDNLSLSVMPGEIHGFIGHNGAGKGYQPLRSEEHTSELQSPY